MMTDYICYPDMKSTKEQWLGNIPSSWGALRLKRMFSIKKDIAGEEGYAVLSVTQKGIRPKVMTDKGQFAQDYSHYQLVNRGEFVMNHMDLLTGWVDISDYDGVTSPDYRVFVNTDPEKYNSGYYRYIFQLCYSARIFYGLGQGVAGFGRWRLPADMFLNFILPVPSIQEQEKIAAYLDDQVFQIDSIIEEAKSSVEEYKQWKESMIFEAVTKGLDSKAAMKDSGIEWIGKIPEHWDIPSVRNFFQINRGRVIAKTEISLEPGEGLYPIYSSQTKNKGCMGYIDTYDFEKEGLTWTTDGANAGTVFYRNGKFNCTNVCGILTAKDGMEINLRYCNYSIGYSAHICRRADINGYKIMSNEMAAIKFVLPSSIKEQLQVADYLDSKCNNIDSLITEKEELIADLESYKRSLIYEFVTGKRKVV